MSNCRKCKKILSPDEIALHKKLINRGAEEFLCIGCLAEHFDVPVDLLKDKIVEFKKMGCTLFRDIEQ